MNVCAYSLHTCFITADHWFLVFSVMLKSSLMQLYIRSCHMVSAEIAVATAVPIENPADCEVRGVIRFPQVDEILGYLDEEASSRMNCSVARPHTAQQTQALLCEQFYWYILEHPPYSPDLAPSDFFLFPKMEHLAGKCFTNEDLTNAVDGHMV